MSTGKDIINVTRAGDISFASNVTSFLQALNPLGAIADTVGVAWAMAHFVSPCPAL